MNADLRPPERVAFQVYSGVRGLGYTRALTAALLVRLVAAVAVGVPIYALGILVSAAGQVLKATLDSAVHTSPFLDQNQMAQSMA